MSPNPRLTAGGGLSQGGARTELEQKTSILASKLANFALTTTFTLPTQHYKLTQAQSANAKRLAANLARAAHTEHKGSQSLVMAERRRWGGEEKREMPVPWKPEAWTLGKIASKLPRGYHVLKPGQKLPKGAVIVKPSQLAGLHPVTSLARVSPGLITPRLGAGSHMLDGEDEAVEGEAGEAEAGDEGEEGVEGGEAGEERRAEESEVVEMTPHERIDFAHEQHMLARKENNVARNERQQAAQLVKESVALIQSGWDKHKAAEAGVNAANEKVRYFSRIQRRSAHGFDGVRCATGQGC